ncbi:MAG: acyltransferase [Dehalococcoidia bacterium]
MQEYTSTSRRLPAIDILRGLAIAWVVLFHLWGDMEFFPLAPKLYYEAFADRVGDGEGWPAFTAFTDLLFRLGFQGVPLFMMISGVSLTIAAYRSGDGLAWARFFGQRFRKLLVPYWAGVALTYSVMALIAWRQAALGIGGFEERFTGGVTIALGSAIHVDSGVAFASVGLVPRLLRNEWFFAPQLALWFVGLLAQYYLLFPVLFLLMRRVGIIAFLIATFGLTVGANWWIVHEYGAPEFQFRLVTGWAPFRLFEFTAGMAVGALLVDPRRKHWLRALRHPASVGAALTLGVAVHTAGGLMIGDWSLRYWQSMALPLSTLGLALLALPLLTAPAGRLQLSLPMRALAFIGTMSYTVLIVNDAMRLVASQLRFEGLPDGWWWAFLIVVYVPASVGLAWPLARVLRLLPARSAAEREPAVPLSEPDSVLLPAVT